MVSIKIFVSDEGFGHIVRQKAIIGELIKHDDVDIVLQTQKHFEAAQNFIGGGISYNLQFNNIMTIKKEDGSLDMDKTYEFIKNYPENSKELIEKELDSFNYDFVISDFVPEAFHVSKSLGISNCGAAHFTWDWFFSKLYPSDKALINTLNKYVECVDEIYFPPLTPDENLDKFKDRAKVVPFIISEDYLGQKTKEPAEKLRILISDSGTGALYHIIKKNLPVFKSMTDFHFFLPPMFKVEADNITIISRTEDVPKLIPQLDLVVARAGFNTITMCIIARVPLLLVEEKGSPEVEENLRKVSELGLCGELPPEKYSNNFKSELEEFLKKDFDTVKKNMQNYKFKTNGAEIIAKEILKRIK
ncbi:MAG: hypothetical protein KAV43_04295 [Hadesarchaea archaeon]|nr:hypothetical protein [Hadesarchaea archaeon]